MQRVRSNYWYRINVLVEEKIVAELKTVERFTYVYFARILTYLNLGSNNLGYLINFHTNLLKNGIKGLINTFL